MLLTIFLVSLLAIGAVSAADNGADDNIIGEAYDMDLASQDTNNVLTADEQTFTQLNQTINGNNNSEITLTSDYKYSDVDDFENGIVINRDVTIYGNGHTINGDGRARIFNIAGGNVVFYNIEFTNGYAFGSGGAIYGACKAINCNFIKNNANNGGAMYEGTAQNCNFTENTATGVMGSGGAMYKGSARECTFIENSAHVGGAMYYCSAVDCVFKKNSANTGGAVYSGSVVTGTFIGNTALVLAHSMCFACVWNCIGEKDKDFYENKDLVLHWDVSDHFTSEYNSGDALHIVLKSQNDEFVNLIDCDVVVYKDGVMVKTYPCFSGDGLSFDLAAGNYTVEPAVSYPGLNQPSPISIQLTINKATSNIEVSASDAVYPDNVTVNVRSNVTGDCTVKVGNESQSVNLVADVDKNVTFIGLVTNEKGYAVNVVFNSENYTSFNDSVSVKVIKATPTLTAGAKTFKFEDKTKKFQVTLKDNKGSPMKNTEVTLKVNGITYTATTNANGVATFTLNKLSKQGSFNVVVKYLGDDNYKSLSKKVKLTVKAPAFKTLSYGSKDKAMIKKIQTVLKDKGFYTWAYGHYLKLDGIYHKYTVHAVKQFQKANNLKVTGKVDYKTAQKLKIVK